MKLSNRIYFYLIFPIVISCLSTQIRALEVELSMKTSLFTSELAVYKASKNISEAIKKGSNEEALAEAFLECPEDNQPNFQVNSIGLSTLWLADASSLDDKRYRGIINYVLKCKHDRRRGGDR